ncbi:MAG: nickel pincer cofactor biosynthesis protein LarC [Candidatus Bathyarchaeota archaeon]|nr:nickel pincer cofactor biosynthesis protein LarC [Candidatus Bathyarchaeota archaeon]
MRVLVIDCQLAGIAGDMLVGSLLDLGVDIPRFIEAMEDSAKYLEGCDCLVVEVEDVVRRGFRAKKLHVKAKETGHHHLMGSKLREAILNIADDFKLSENAKVLATRTIDSLIGAEAKVHGETPSEVHLHEAGSIDTVVDIIGTVYALDELGLTKDTKIYSTPVAVGGGIFKFSHGNVQSPAPATLEILRAKGFPLVGGPIDFELTTPTGAALLVNIVDEVTPFYPPIKPTRIGYGSGTKDFESMPNIVRLTLGEPTRSSLMVDEIYVLETNLDDATGEVIGYTIDRMLQGGARDISVIPMTTKKNRPGHILKVITDRENVHPLTMLLMEETGTLGVRMYPSKRHILTRDVTSMEVKLEGLEGMVQVKVSRNREGRVIQVKPEFEDVRSLAEKTGKTLREIMRLVTDQARREIASH